MIKRGCFLRNTAAVTLALAAFAMLTPAQAALRIPYAPDEETLHLWHLDETEGTVASDATTASPIPLTMIGIPLAGPFTTTSFGNPSFPGLGTAVRGTTRQHLMYGGAFPDVTEFRHPETGAFTFEAIVKFDTDPLATIDAEIVSGDNGMGIGSRGWQWRIFNGVMEWNLLAGSVDNNYKVPLPATGPNAAVVGAWYHVAITYSGSFPTDGSQPDLIRFYWTLLDENRTEADQLGEPYQATRPLDGAPQGASQPSLGVGGSARNTTTNPGNNEGIIGSIDEVRISRVARAADEMAFAAGGGSNPPEFTAEPPPARLVNFGDTLSLAALVSGTPPLEFRWQRNEVDIQGQDETTLVIPNVTFAEGGDYRLIVQNDHGSITSSIVQVTIGAGATGLRHTGLDPDGTVSAGNIPDPHWTLARSSDPFYLGPDAPIFEYSFPIQFASPDGNFSPVNGVSMWIGAAPNTGGFPATSPAGRDVYRARFLLDTADPETVQLSGNLWINGALSDIVVNGNSTGITRAPGGTLYVTTFEITDGFVAGWNTVDFVETLGGAGVAGIRVEIRSSGLALEPGVPVFLDEPDHETVQTGTKAIFSAAAQGRPPLAYQWLLDGEPIVGAASHTLILDGPTESMDGNAYSVRVTNDSGSVTSAAAVLNIVPGNQAPVPAALSYVAFQGQPLAIWLSDIIQQSVDPDHDPLLWAGSDFNSTAGGLVEQIDAVLNYTPPEGHLGADQFGYTISDQNATSPLNASGVVQVLTLGVPASQTTPVGSSATFSSGLSAVPAGYQFAWLFKGSPITGQTGAQLTVANAQVANAGSYRLQVTDPNGQVWLSPTFGLNVGTTGTGTGLTGRYFNDLAAGVTDFEAEPILTRIDPVIDFNWGTDSPDFAIGLDLFSVRWTGQVQPLYSDVYTFSTRTDDGARLWVNGQQLVNAWQNQAATTFSGTIALQAGQKYNLIMEYYENTSSASAQLLWSSEHQASEVIPMTQLYPELGTTAPELSVTRTSPTALQLDWSGTFTLQSKTDLGAQWTDLAVDATGPYPVAVGTEEARFFRLIDAD